MRRDLIIAGSVIAGVFLLGMWLGSWLTKQSTQPKLKPTQVQIQKKSESTKPEVKKQKTAKSAPKPKPITPTQTQTPAVTAPAPQILLISICVQHTMPAPTSAAPQVQLNGGWASGPTYWVPGYQRWVCEGPSPNTRCYWTWEPAHYE